MRTFAGLWRRQIALASAGRAAGARHAPHLYLLGTVDIQPFMCFICIQVGAKWGAMGVKRKSWIQPSEAAKYFDVTSSTIREWISDGKLRAAKLPTGHLRILARC